MRTSDGVEMEQPQVFVTIQDFPAYQIGSHGDVYSLKTERVLKCSLNRGGYRQVALCKPDVRATVMIHRLVAQYYVPNPDGFPCVDHINGIKTDNRASNLRWCTQSQNLQNRHGKSDSSSRFKGVSWDACARKWTAQIELDNKKKHLGRYDSEEMAARVYDAESRVFHGEFALLNFPDEAPVPRFVKRENSSSFRGVSWAKRDRKWRAKIEVKDKTKHLGYFDDEEEAARAFDAAAREAHGTKAKLNFN